MLHFHEEPYLAMIFNGCVIDKRKNCENEMSSGGLIFYHAGENHQIINRIVPNRYMSLSFNWDFLSRKSITEAKLDILINKNPASKFTILKIYKEILENDESSEAAMEMLMFNLIDEKIEIKLKRPSWINKVHQLLNDNWNKPLSLRDLAIVADVHPKTISRQFPKYFSCTLGEYRRQQKINKSFPLIKSSKLTLTEIAHECNFADQSHFIRTFKEMTGFLPKHFQKL